MYSVFILSSWADPNDVSSPLWEGKHIFDAAKAADADVTDAAIKGAAGICVKQCNKRLIDMSHCLSLEKRKKI